MAALHLNPDLRDRVEAVLQTEQKRATGILSEIGISAIGQLANRLGAGQRLGQTDIEEFWAADCRPHDD